MYSIKDSMQIKRSALPCTLLASQLCTLCIISWKVFMVMFRHIHNLSYIIDKVPPKSILEYILLELS